MTSHAAARAFVIDAFTAEFGRAPVLLEAQFAQAVSLGESHYGDACYRNIPAGTSTCNTNNMGAIQCGSKPPCPPGCFEATDHRANGQAYQACFRLWDDKAEAFRAFIHTVYVSRHREAVRLAALTGSIPAFSTALRASGYFELPLRQHIRAMTNNLRAITRALKEPMPGEPARAAGKKLGGVAIAVVALGGAALIAAKVA